MDRIWKSRGILAARAQLPAAFFTGQGGLSGSARSPGLGVPLKMSVTHPQKAHLSSCPLRQTQYGARPRCKSTSLAPVQEMLSSAGPPNGMEVTCQEPVRGSSSLGTSGFGRPLPGEPFLAGTSSQRS